MTEENKKMRKQRSMMYTQQLDRLQIKDDWKAETERIVKATEPLYWACILHDKDLNEDGEPAEPHIHLMMYFKHARSPKSVAWEISGKEGKREDAKTERLEFFKRPNNGYSYLVHKTENAKEKYQYPIEDVISNFDYAEKIEQITRSVERNKGIKESELIKEFLDMLYDGEITPEEIETELSGSQYAKASPRIKIVSEKRQDFLNQEYLKKMREENKPKTVIYFYGKSGFGKTRLAKVYAESLDDDYFITGSSRDPFQGYRNQTTVIIDELRHNTFRYEDLLKMLDPYNYEVMIPSRYYDKALTAEIILITSPYSPRDIYDSIFGEDSIDNFEQLERRIDEIILVEENYIYKAVYDEEKKDYIKEPSSKTANPFKTEKENKTRLNFYSSLLGVIVKQNERNEENKET